MKEKIFVKPVIMTVLAVLFTFAVKYVDVQPVGFDGTNVGFAGINSAVYTFLGANRVCYAISNVIGIIAIITAACFGFAGFMQLIKRKSLLKVDKIIIALGILYIVTISLYFIFARITINLRPIPGFGETELEPSFPSSHTLLVCTVMGSAVISVKRLIQNLKLRKILIVTAFVTIAIAVVSRLACGVHWFTDILGGAIYSIVLVSFFKAFIEGYAHNN